MKHLITLALLGALMIGCNGSVSHSPKASFTDSIDNRQLSRHLTFTEEFTRENHQYIRFHYDYPGGHCSDAVVHNPDCIYCDINKPVEQIYKEQ